MSTGPVSHPGAQSSVPESLWGCPVVQVAYQVEDVRAAARRWNQAFGVGPFFVQDHVPLVRATSGGRPVRFDQSCAVTQWGDVMLELVAHHSTEPVELERTLVPRPSGLHHLAVMVEDLDATLERLEKQGVPVVLDAETPEQRFVFVDPGAQGGHLIECYEATPYLTRLYGAVRRAAERWDGLTLFR